MRVSFFYILVRNLKNTLGRCLGMYCMYCILNYFGEKLILELSTYQYLKGHFIGLYRVVQQTPFNDMMTSFDQQRK